jgi:MoaA/NifB/PqqE/SkfB family radical SAM enzyme
MVSTKSTNADAKVNKKGDLVISRDVALGFGLEPGDELSLRATSEGILLRPSLSRLRKVYIEPTTRCNLSCRTCIRNAWEEPQGDMAAETWQRVIESVKELPSRPDIFFGGFGEPLLLPNIADMVSTIKALAGKVELITNGMLLTEKLSRELIDAGLDTLWVSLDGATPENFADVRLGATLPTVIDNISRFNSLRKSINPHPEIGISFVAMRKNISDLPVLIRMSTLLGASRYMVTNVLPYTAEMCQEVLYTRSVDGLDSAPSFWSPQIDLPRMDLNEVSQEAIVKAIRNRHNVRLNGVTLGQERGHCPFIERGSLTIDREGAVSPCLGLMHNHITYLNGVHRSVRKYRLGTLNESDLKSIWNMPEYVDFRKRVEAFDFSPCITCGGCSWSETNEEDCFANTFPTCGGCLWAQGVIQCP